MSLPRIGIALLVFAFLLGTVRAADPARELAKVEGQLKKKPDDPALNTRKAQLLSELKKYDESYAAAKKALECSIKAGDATQSILLETVDLGHALVEIHFNMGDRERRPPEMGIVRPVSFKVFKKGAKGAKGDQIEVIDFELGYIGGKPDTAALGQKQEGGGHANFGTMDPATAFKDVREKALELVLKRNPAPEGEKKK